MNRRTRREECVREQKESEGISWKGERERRERERERERSVEKIFSHFQRELCLQTDIRLHVFATK